MPIYKNGQKNNLRNYRPVNLTLVPGKVMELVILNLIVWHMQDNQEFKSRKHEFVKGRSCLSNSSPPMTKVTYLYDEGKAVDVV